MSLTSCDGKSNCRTKWEREEKTMAEIPSVLLNTVPVVPQVTEKISVVLLFCLQF